MTAEFAGRYRHRDTATRISDSEVLVEDENTLPAERYRELEESRAMDEKRARDVETFVQASKARWAKPTPSEKDEDNQDDPPGPFGGNLAARPSSLSPTPNERAERMATTADTTAEKFAAASRARWRKR